MSDRKALWSSKDIVEYCGIASREIRFFVEHHGFPAFKMAGKRNWYVRPASAYIWARMAETKFLNNKKNF